MPEAMDAFALEAFFVFVPGLRPVRPWSDQRVVDDANVACATADPVDVDGLPGVGDIHFRHDHSFRRCEGGGGYRLHPHII